MTTNIIKRSMEKIELSNNQQKFDALTAKLRKHGYTVSIANGQEYSIAAINGQGIRGGFAVSHWNEWGHHDVPEYIFNRITFDKAEVFNKYSTCVCSYSMPGSQEEIEFTLQQMQRLRDRKVTDPERYLLDYITYERDK